MPTTNGEKKKIGPRAVVNIEFGCVRTACSTFPNRRTKSRGRDYLDFLRRRRYRFSVAFSDSSSETFARSSLSPSIVLFAIGRRIRVSANVVFYFSIFLFFRSFYFPSNDRTGKVARTSFLIESPTLVHAALCMRANDERRACVTYARAPALLSLRTSPRRRRRRARCNILDLSARTT